jgi:hypothetical protein
MSRFSRTPFKMPLLVSVLGLGLLAPPARSLADINANGLSDLWEQQFNNGVPFDPALDPGADDDGDGWTNAQEAAAGTHPFDGNPPGGILRPAILQIPAVFGDPDENGNPVVLTPDALQVSWPTLKGKRYTLQFSTDLTLGGWSEVESPVLGNGGTLTYTFVQESSALFWRVIVADHDSDGDEFTDWEEDQKGTDSQVADRDDDGLPDTWEMENGFDPNDNGTTNAANGPDGDSDGDGVSNADELAGNSDPNNPADFPVRVIQITKGASGRSNYTAYDPPTTPYLGQKNWSAWWIPGNYTEAPVTDEAVTPTYLDPIVQGIAFPATPPTPPQDHPECVPQWNLAGSSIYCRSHVNRPPTGNGIESGLTSSRVWIKAPAAPVERSFAFVKVRDYSTHVHVTETNPTNINTHTFVSAEVVAATIPANETISNPIDLKYPAPILDGCDVTAYERLLPLEVTVMKEGETNAPDDGLIIKKADIVRYRILTNESTLLKDKIQWHWRILKWDGTYSEWTAYTNGQGHTFTAQPADAGIYEVKAIADGQELFLKRAKDDVHSAKKKDENDCFGVVEHDWQINVRNQAKMNLGSVAYAKAAANDNVKAGDYKCNLFVGHKATNGGAAVPKINGNNPFSKYYPIANQWAGTQVANIPGWILLPINTYPQPGYIVARGVAGGTGHTGIVDYDGAWIGAGTFNVNRNADLRNEISLRSGTATYQPARFNKYTP